MRPITGETVNFTCEVEGRELTWLNEFIGASGRIAIVTSAFNVGEENEDSTSGESLICTPKMVEGEWEVRGERRGREGEGEERGERR